MFLKMEHGGDTNIFQHKNNYNDRRVVVLLVVPYYSRGDFTNYSANCAKEP